MQRKCCYLNVLYVLGCQIRTFKTERSVIAEIGRNPTLFSRIRNFLGLDDNIKSPTQEDKLLIGPYEVDKMKSKLQLNYNKWSDLMCM